MNKKGFTLLELSIVMVIIGLLVGVVSVGQDLIEAAKLRKVVSTKESYVLAVHSFRLKYNCLPGDCRDAASFFPQQPECTNPGAWNGIGCEATNGNGDRRVTLGGPVEHYPFWHQLGEAEMIKHRYSGKGVNGLSGDMRIGVNLPSSEAFENYAYAIYNRGRMSGDFNYYDGHYGHVLLLGAPREGKIPILPALTNAQAENIDSKIDEGKPGIGIFRTLKPGFYTPHCGSSTNPITSTYDLNDDREACAVMFTDIF